jgi:hypothetical protein
MNDELTDKTDNFSKACQMASGMLVHDRQKLIFYALLLTIPSLLAVSFSKASISAGILIQIIDRIVQITIIYIIGSRWVNSFSKGNDKIELKNTLKDSKYYLLLTYGFIFWLLFQLPAIILFVSTNALVKILAIFMWAPAIALGLTFYFYFIPILFGLTKFKDIKNVCLDIYQQDRMTAVKTIIAPMAIMLLFSSVLGIISPDDRVAWILDLKNLTSIVFFVLNFYLAFSAGLINISNNTWHQLRLEPYRVARFETIAINGINWVAKILQPKNGLKILLLASLIGLANIASLSSLKPAANFEIEKIIVSDGKITLNILAKDEQYLLRGVAPQLLTVAGPEMQLITETRMANEIAVNNQPISSWQTSLEKSPQAKISLTFKTDRKARDLKSLEDLYLWYRNTKILKLEMQSANNTQP